MEQRQEDLERDVVSTESRVVVGLDVGTTKICALVAEVSSRDRIRVIGLGIEPAHGMHKGMVVDVDKTTESVKAARRSAEKSSGYEIGRAYVSIGGKHIDSLNSRGVTGLNPNKGVTASDIDRALEAAQAEALRHNREVLHVIPRAFTLDDRPDIRNPIGMYAYRLGVEAHIITSASSSLRSLEKCVNDAGLAVDRFILNQLASGEVTLTDAERESGVAVIDIGGGTTDVAVFIEGSVWHTSVIEVGGNHITSDIAHVLHLPQLEAERVKIEYGDANPEGVDPDALVTVTPFGEERVSQFMAYDLSRIIEARVDEIFALVMQELKRSGYDSLLPAGVVLTGGSAALKNIRHSASKVMNLPARVAQPDKITGLVDRLMNPAYSTAVGLLSFGLHPDDAPPGPGSDSKPRRPRIDVGAVGKKIGEMFGRLLPGE
jgi:cell division protein FtsA